MPQPPLQHVEVDRRPDVPDVRLRLDRQAADIEPGLPLLEGHEVTDLAGLGVVEPDHRSSLGRGWVWARFRGTGVRERRAYGLSRFRGTKGAQVT